MTTTVSPESYALLTPLFVPLSLEKRGAGLAGGGGLMQTKMFLTGCEKMLTSRLRSLSHTPYLSSRGSNARVSQASEWGFEDKRFAWEG